jgi:hypothetical protein
VRIDLHTHSTASDGTESPTEVVRSAVAAGLDVLALTDHDSSHGWAEAAAAATEAGLALVRGMEISTRHEGRGVHLLAYLPDPSYEPLDRELRAILDGRSSRVPAVVERLQELGIEIEMDDVLRAAGPTAALGRPHIADALVTLGVVADRNEAFATLLGAGCPAYVDRYAAPLRELIPIITAAGGVSVIAHPWGRHLHTTLDRDDLAKLRDLGLAGVEVDHQDHDPETRDRLRAVARELDLVVTGSSDYHGLGKKDHPLGCNTTSPDDYARLVELAAEASRASGRRTPGVVAP